MCGNEVPGERESERESALWRLTERLHEKMENLDPGGWPAWSDLTDIERNYFYFSLKSVLLEKADVLKILEVDNANGDMIIRPL